jgi:hypothetical protein
VHIHCSRWNKRPALGRLAAVFPALLTSAFSQADLVPFKKWLAHPPKNGRGVAQAMQDAISGNGFGCSLQKNSEWQ